MKSITTLMFSALALLAAASPALAQDIVSDVQKGCATEIEQYCSQVMMGEYS